MEQGHSPPDHGVGRGAAAPAVATRRETALNISVITPAAKRSRSGNRATAVRWARILGSLGHSVTVGEAWPGAGGGRKGPDLILGRENPGRPGGLERPDDPGGGPGSPHLPGGPGSPDLPREPDGPGLPGQREGPDLLVAIHAWRSAASVAAFRGRYPSRPLVVLMSGTDIYRYQHSHREETIASMAAADRLVGLHDLVAGDLPPRFRAKLRIVHQSALPLRAPRNPTRRNFDVCVVGHLRDEKDPFRAAYAARRAPGASRLRIVHLGKPHDAAHAREARAEMARNPRYVWRGEAPRWQVRRIFARCHAMVISSIMEGGANVVSEAVVAGVPVIASDIPGNVGLLGAGHPARYPAGDTGALAALLHRAETEPGFLDTVRAHGDARRDRFSPERERAAWAALLGELA